MPNLTPDHSHNLLQQLSFRVYLPPQVLGEKVVGYSKEHSINWLIKSYLGLTILNDRHFATEHGVNLNKKMFFM